MLYTSADQEGGLLMQLTPKQKSQNYTVKLFQTVRVHSKLDIR
jgi:hypothetical protein